MRVHMRRGGFLATVSGDPLKGLRTSARRLDVRGLPNPEPVLQLAQDAANLRPGERIDVLTNDPCAMTDFLRWSGQTDVELIEIKYLGDDVTNFTFRRRATVPRSREASTAPSPHAARRVVMSAPESHRIRRIQSAVERA